MKKWLKALLCIGLGLLNIFLMNKFNIDGTLGFFMTCLGIFLIVFAIFKYIGIKEFIAGIIFGGLI